MLIGKMAALLQWQTCIGCHAVINRFGDVSFEMA